MVYSCEELEGNLSAHPLQKKDALFRYYKGGLQEINVYPHLNLSYFLIFIIKLFPFRKITQSHDKDERLRTLLWELQTYYRHHNQHILGRL